MDFIGIGVAIMRRKLHPQLSLWVGIYFSIKAILNILGLIVNSMVVNMFNEHTFGNIGVLLTLTGLFSTALNIITLVILLYIIFGWRDEKTPLMIFKS